MRFIVKQVGCGSERVGSLTGFLKSSGAVFETPTTALATQGGSVVHLTADILSRVFPNPQLLWVPLANTLQLENGLKAQGEGLAKFSALSEHVISITLHGASDRTPAGHFEMDKVPLWTKGGKKMFTAEKYMGVMEVFKPDLVLAIADGRTTLSEGPKRIAKSVERTNHMLEICVQQYKDSEKFRNSTSLIAVIVGTALDKRCQESIKNILAHQEYIQGVALAGLTDGTEDTTKIPVEMLERIFMRVGTALPNHLVRIIEGCWNPAVVVAAIEHGWDVFDGSYPLHLTNAGHALALNFTVDRKSTELCILDLNSKRYKEEFRPVLEGCECLCCRKHTRAYIRHLLNTREMLASVLLSIHNLHHFDQLFYHARLHIKAATFNMFKVHITEQYNLYKDSQAKEDPSKCDKETVINVDATEEETQETSQTGSPLRNRQRKKIKIKQFVRFLAIVVITSCLRATTIVFNAFIGLVFFGTVVFILFMFFMILITEWELIVSKIKG